MDNQEVLGLTQIVKEANGLQLHNISGVAINRLREINAECGEELVKQKLTTEQEANAAKAKEIETAARGEDEAEPADVAHNIPRRR